MTRLLRTTLREQADQQIGLAASGAAFWLIIAAFPTAIAAVNIFGLIVSPSRVAADLSGLTHSGPASFGSVLSDQLRHVVSTDHARLSIGLVISLILGIWSASGGVYNLDRAIRTAYGLPPLRYVDARGRALLGACGAVIALGALAFASAGTSHLLANAPTPVIAIIGIPALIAGVAVGIAGVYRFSVGRRIGFRAILPGAVASACGLAVVVIGFGIYLNFSDRYTAIYGTLAGAVIALIGTYLAVYVVLLGAVLNVLLARQE